MRVVKVRLDERKYSPYIITYSNVAHVDVKNGNLSLVWWNGMTRTIDTFAPGSWFDFRDNEENKRK